MVPVETGLLPRSRRSHEAVLMQSPPIPAVFAQERQRRIAQLVEEHGRARRRPGCEFGVSTVTIRKDLVALEQQGALVRTHGGAVVGDRTRAERAFEIRERFQRATRRTTSAPSPRASSSTARASPWTPARRRSRWPAI